MKPRWAWGIGTALALLLSVAALRRSFPLLPHPLVLAATWDATAPGQADPLVATGVPGTADFLFLRRVSKDSVVFAYDSWGNGGPSSAPVTWAPGSTHRLAITLPSLGPIEKNPSADSGPLRVTCDDRLVLEGIVHHHWRQTDQVFVGINPLGGSSCGPEFHGILRAPDGRSLHGGARALFTVRERISGFWTDGAWRIWPLVATSALVVWGLGWLGRFWRRYPPRSWPWPGIAAGAVSLLAFGYAITGGSFRFLYPEEFGSFYDFQAHSLLHGRLDVPGSSLAGEAFHFEGKTYGYFGATPAILRFPFVALGVAFAELSRSLMCAYFLACLLFSGLILRQAFALVRPQENGAARPSAGPQLLFLVAVGLGSPFLFLGSRAYIYHEAILCGAAFALAACYCTLRYLGEPARRWWLGALGCGFLTTHARPSTGLFVLTFTGLVALIHLVARPPAAANRSSFRRGRVRHFLVGIGCVLAVLSFNAQGYLKFRTFDGVPLRYHMQYYPGRLDRIGGKNFHLANLPFNLESYFGARTFLFRANFPFFRTTGRYFKDSASLAGLRLDQVEPMLALPYAVPAFCLLALIGLSLLWTGPPPARRAVLLIWIAVLPFAAAMFMAIATAERYTADFCPFLIMAAALGLAVVDGWRRRAAALAALAILTLWSVFAMMALTLRYQGVEVWGVDAGTKKNYETLSQAVDRFLHLPPPVEK